MHDWKDAGADFVLADRGSCMRDESFDLVVFNPPYLESPDVTDVAVDGGVQGEVPLAFLREALRVVKGTGRIMMLLSDGNPVGPFESEGMRRGFRMEKVSERRLFFEKLTVYELRR